MDVLITGSAGFVGSYFRRRLDVPGNFVVCIDTDDPKVPMDCRQFFRESDRRFDLIIHCAALVGGRAVIDGQPLNIANNMGLDAALFNFALRTRAKQVVYFSSSAAYPVEFQTGPCLLREDDIDLSLPRLPDQTYGWAKLTGEILAEKARAEGLKVNVFRPFSGTGPGQTLDYPVPAICARAAGHKSPLTVWADVVRDVIHVEDIVEGVLATLDQGYEGPLNLCTGIATRLSVLARMAADEASYFPTIDVLTGKPTGVQYRVGDPTEFHKVYRPKRDLGAVVHELING
jgi:nucleoside-diphosphate-sugar epimerase